MRDDLEEVVPCEAFCGEWTNNVTDCGDFPNCYRTVSNVCMYNSTASGNCPEGRSNVEYHKCYLGKCMICDPEIVHGNYYQHLNGRCRFFPADFNAFEDDSIEEIDRSDIS